MSQQTPQNRVLLPRVPALLLAGVFVTVFLSFFSAFAPSLASAATSNTLNFQARLQTAQGSIVPDGNYNVEFKLYNTATVTGTPDQGACTYNSGTADPNCLWVETRTSANQVRVANGYLTVSLGSVNAFPATINWDQQLWLTMRVGGTNVTPSWDGEMSPRLQLTAVPYAFKAGQLAQYNATSGYTSTLSLLQPTVGNQTFQVANQGAAGTYTICVQSAAAANGGCAPTSGGSGYIQNQSASPQTANFFIQSSTTTPGGIIRGASGQSSGDIFVVQDGTGTPIFDVNGAGDVNQASINNYAGGLKIGGGYNSHAGQLYVTPASSSDNIGVVVQGTSSQTGALLEFQNSSGAVLSKFDASGNLTVPNVTVTAGGTISMVGNTTAMRPAAPTEGMLYYDTTLKQLLTYANGKWQADRRSNTFIVAASNSSQAEKDSADYVADGDTAAAGDGDQIQINQALSAAATNGGTVYLMEGTYTVDASVSIPNNVTLEGAGNATLITIPNSLSSQNSNGNISIITNSDTSTGTGIAVKDIQLNGNKGNQSTGTQNGIKLVGMGGGSGGSARNGALISNVTISSFRTSGIYASSSAFNTFADSTFRNSDYADVEFSGTTNSTFSGDLFQGSQYGVDNYSSSDGNTFTDNTFQDATAYGVWIESNSNTISGNTFANNEQVGILLGSGSSNNTVSGNTVYGGNEAGIFFNNSNNNVVTANRVVDPGGSTTNMGIELYNGSASNLITNNSITDSSCTSTCYAISIEGTTGNNNYLANNTLGNGTINDQRTTTQYSNQLNSSGVLMTQNSGGTKIEQAASQTADLLQLQTSTGTVLGGFTSNGALYTNGTSNTFAGLSYPSGLAVTTAGTAGTTTYAYRVSALNSQGETIATPEVTIATGNATLSTTNYNVVTWNGVAGATSYKLYGRTGGSELYMATITSTGAGTYTYNDQGAATPSGALPAGSSGSTFILQGWAGQSGALQILQAGIGQSGDLLQFKTSSGTVLAKVDANGNLLAPSLDTVSAGALTIGGTNANSVTIGNVTNTATMTLNATGTLNLGDNANNKTINIGATGSTANTTTVNIAISTGAAQTVTIGSTNGASATTVNGGSGGVNLNGATTVKGATSDTSANAFVLQNSSSTNLLTMRNDGQLTVGWTSGSGTTSTFGNTSYPSLDSSDSNFFSATSFTTGANGGALSSISVYVGGIDPGTANDKFRVAIYADGGANKPTTLLGQSAEGTLTAQSFNTLSVNASLSPNTKYWLAYNTNGTASGYNDFGKTTGTINQYYEFAYTYGSFPSTANATGTNAATAMAIYGTYTIAGSSTVPALTVAANGNVGIGVTQGNGPNYALDVQSGDINTSGVYRASGTQGASITCSSGQFLQNQVVQGGIVTGGTCTTVSGGGGSYVTLQASTPGTPDTGNLNISGTGIFGTALQAPGLDTASAGTLSLGNTNATTINIGTISAGRTIGLGNSNAATSVQLQAATGTLALNTSGVAVFTQTNAANNIATFTNSGNTRTTSIDQYGDLNVDASASVFTNMVKGYSNASLQVLSQGSGSITMQTTTGGIQLQSQGTIGIASNASAQTVNIGNSTGATGVTITTGTSNITMITNGTAAGTTIKSGTNSTTALQIQNSSGQNLLGADTTTGSILLGQASVLNGTLEFANSSNTNTISLSVGAISASYNLVLPTVAPSAGSQCLETASGSTTNLSWGTCGGGGSHVKAITMVPEYAGAVFNPSGTNNTGNMSTNYVHGLTAAQGYHHNYYDWTTDQTTAQNYDITVQYQIPSDFSSFVSGSWKLWTYADSLASTAISWTVLSANDTACYASSPSALPSTAATWQQISLSDPGNGCTFAAGDTITIDIQPSAIQPSTNQVRVGEFTFQYNTAY